jgi:8-oxo-dGTP pyrophosphatase MutT (NUDIX family)
MPDIPDLDSWLSTQTWPDVRELVSRGPTTLYQHPYGFVVCRLEVEWFPSWQIRVHLWPGPTEILRRLRESDSAKFLVHCHGWNLKSVVCIGAFSESLYAIDESGEDSLSVYRVLSDYAVGSSELVLKTGRVRQDHISQLRRDTSTGVWSIRAGQFHSTMVTEGPAVSIVATSRIHRGQSMVIGPSISDARISKNRSAVEDISLLLQDCSDAYARLANGADNWASFVFLVDENSRILLIRPSRRPDLWQPVGGRAEQLDQDPVATVIRETREEVGVHLHPSQLSELTVEDRDVGEGLTYFWVARVRSAAIGTVAYPEILEWRWMSINDISGLATYAGTRSALQLLHQRFEDENNADE